MERIFARLDAVFGVTKSDVPAIVLAIGGPQEGK
jgi:hypothetical protein